MSLDDWKHQTVKIIVWIVCSSCMMQVCWSLVLLCHNSCEHVPWSKLDDQRYWLSKYHAAKRTEYSETLSTEPTNNRSTDYLEVCTEHKVVSAEYNERAPDEKGTEYDDDSTKYNEISTEYNEVRTEYKQVSTAYEDLSTEYGVLSTEQDKESTEYNEESTEYDEESTEYNNESTEYNEYAPNIMK